MKKGDSITLSITDINNLGCGVGRSDLDGRVIFVKGAVTGDTIRATVIKVQKSFCVAKSEEILTPSPFRLSTDPCSAPLACGGCVYRSVTYDHELMLKQNYVMHAFRKVGLSDVTVLPAQTTGHISGYRNKGQYPFTKTKTGVRAGFYATQSHTVIPTETCAIQNPGFSPLVQFLCTFANRVGWSVYDEKSGTGLLRHLYLRVGEQTHEYMVCLVINGTHLPDADRLVAELTQSFPQVSGILVNFNQENTNVILGKKFLTLYGKAYIEDELCGLRFRIAPNSFYQVNREGAELLYRLARQAADLQGNEVLMDLYCGTGTIGLSMAQYVKKLYGVEIVADAVSCARENALRNGISNAEFVCADAGDSEVLLRITKGTRPDIVVIDPPRKGTTRELIDCLSALQIPKIVYVSCDPDTLARDCARFSSVGYQIGKIQPVDMFPRTGHVESVVCLTRK